MVFSVYYYVKMLKKFIPPSFLRFVQKVFS